MSDQTPPPGQTGRDAQTQPARRGSYLDEVVQQIKDADAGRERSQQTAIGWSGMSGCRAYMGYRLAGEWATDDTDDWAAIRGTALHAWLGELRSAALAKEDAYAEFELKVSYGGVPGHVDEVNYTAGEVTDYKFPSLRSARLFDDPAVLDERFIQPMGYAAGVMETEQWREAMQVKDHPVPLVRLLVAPVDGTFADWRVYERPFDRAVADAALDRYRTVQEMQAGGLELPRDKPLFFCRKWCEYVSLCRGDIGQGDELPEIEDVELAAALERYGEAMEAATEAAKAKELYGGLIKGLRGKARGWSVQMTRPGQGSEVVDLEQVEADYENSGIELPKKWKPGGAPSLNVRRVKE